MIKSYSTEYFMNFLQGNQGKHYIDYLKKNFRTITGGSRSTRQKNNSEYLEDLDENHRLQFEKTSPKIEGTQV